LKKSVLKMSTTDKMAGLFIGLQHNFAKTGVKEFEIFNKKIFFPLPHFADLKLIWKFYIEKSINKHLPKGNHYNLSEFKFDSLAEISNGYPGGSIKQAVEYVLSEKRISLLNKISLSMNEFIDPLTYTKSFDDSK